MAAAAAAPEAEDEVAHLRARQARVGEQRVVGLVLHRAVGADLAHQTLRDNTIETRNKIVGIDPHVHETTQHVKNVIRMNSGKNQVAGQSSFDRNLRGFLIARFADQNDIGILTEECAQDAREIESNVLVGLHLTKAGEIVFDGILGSRNVDLAGIDFIVNLPKKHKKPPEH